MSVIDRIVSAADGLFRAGTSSPQPYRQVGNPNTATQRDTYQLLRAMYFANDLYGEMSRTWRNDGESWASIKELRMVQAALVECYVALTMPGNLPDALPLEFADDNIHAENVRDRIHDVWTWSNWAQKKQLFIRQQAMLGNAFIYVASRADLDGNPDCVYFHLPEPEHVTDLDTDERGYLTYIRTDVPVKDREDPDNPYVETSEWWKAKDRYRMWRTLNTQYGDGKRLGTPQLDDSMRNDYGIDFVPFVHAKHRDTGDVYGLAPIMTAIEKQHELNRKATAFSQQLYRHGKPDKLLEASGGQTNGVYAPPPPIQTNTTTGTIEIGGETWWTAPPGWTISNMIANVNYTAHMAGIDQDIAHLATTDLPELNWYRLSQSGGDASGRALQTLLKPAIAKIEEARGNAETALARADAMALTIGQFAKLPTFDAGSIGTYEDGSFDHQFTARQIIPQEETEEAEILKMRAEIAGVLMREASMDAAGAFRLAGFKPEEIDAALESMTTAASIGIER